MAASRCSGAPGAVPAEAAGTMSLIFDAMNGDAWLFSGTAVMPDVSRPLSAPSHATSSNGGSTARPPKSGIPMRARRC